MVMPIDLYNEDIPSFPDPVLISTGGDKKFKKLSSDATHLIKDMKKQAKGIQLTKAVEDSKEMTDQLSNW